MNIIQNNQLKSFNKIYESYLHGYTFDPKNAYFVTGDKSEKFEFQSEKFSKIAEQQILQYNFEFCQTQNDKLYSISASSKTSLIQCFDKQRNN